MRFPTTLASLTLAALASGATLAHAQAVEPASATTGMHFKSASAYEDGYVHANLIIDYAFNVCNGNVRLAYGIRPGSVDGFKTYWYKGHNYGVPAGTRPPQSPLLTTDLRVSFGAREVYSAVTRNMSVSTDMSCGAKQDIGLGTVSRYDKDAKTPSQMHDVLNRFTFDVGITHEPLRDPAVEREFARELAAAAQKARRDSADATRAALKAQRDSADAARIAERARRDSLDRVAKAQQRAASTASRPSTSGGASGSSSSNRAAGTATNTRGTASGQASTYPSSTAAQREAARERRQADSVAQARADEANRQRQMVAVQEMLKQRQADEEARTQAVNQAASQLGDMVGNILRERAADEERREAREAAAAERKRTYQLKARAAYLAAPARPQCTTADVRQTLTLDQQVAGALTLADCRLSDSSSAVSYRLVLDRPRAVTVTLASSGFYGQVFVENATRVVARGKPYTPLELDLPAGEYRVVVTSEALGETGDYTLLAHRGVLSNTSGISYAFIAGMTSTPFAGRTSMMQEGGLRLGYGLGQHVQLLLQGGNGSTDDGVDDWYWEYGARVNFRNEYETWRPFVFGVTGTHKYDLMQSTSLDHFAGNKNSFGGGVEWFGMRRFSAELAVFQSTGKMTKEGSSTTLSMDGTHYMMGFTYHP